MELHNIHTQAKLRAKLDKEEKAKGQTSASNNDDGEDVQGVGGVPDMAIELRDNLKAIKAQLDDLKVIKEAVTKPSDGCCSMS